MRVACLKVLHASTHITERERECWRARTDAGREAEQKEASNLPRTTLTPGMLRNMAEKQRQDLLPKTPKAMQAHHQLS